MKDKIREDIINYLIAITGAIMGEIDRFFTSRKHEKIPEIEGHNTN